MLVRTDLIGQVIQPWRFTEPEPKLTVHIRDRDAAGNLLGLLLHDARDPKQVATYLAERAQIIKQGEQRLPAHGEGPYPAARTTTKLPRRSSPSPNTSWISTSSSSAPTKRSRSARASATRPNCSGRTPTTAMYKSASGPADVGVARAPRQPALSARVRHDRGGLPGQARRPPARTASRLSLRHFRCATLCRILGIAAANAVAVRPANAYLLYAVPLGAGCWALVRDLLARPLPRPPTRCAAHCRARLSTGVMAQFGRIAAARARRLQTASGTGQRPVRAPNAAPLRGQALPVQHPGRVRCLRRA